jgi:hypothetical protein
MSTNPLGIRFRDAKVSTDNNLYRSIHKCAAAILHGKVLVVDPSIGSVSSQPGYAILMAGKLVEFGTIEIRHTDSSHKRLFELGRSLREDFSSELVDSDFDVLVVEDIPPARYSGSGRNKYHDVSAQLPLHRSVGAILASVKVDHAIAIAPRTWRSFVYDDYVKSDSGDAVVMAHVAVKYAQHAVDAAVSAKAKRKGA